MKNDWLPQDLRAEINGIKQGIVRFLESKAGRQRLNEFLGSDFPTYDAQAKFISDAMDATNWIRPDTDERIFIAAVSEAREELILKRLEAGE